MAKTLHFQRLLTAVLLAVTLIPPTWAAGIPLPFAAAPAIKVPTWVGEFRWLMRLDGQTVDPFRLRLGFTALPSGEWSVTGSLILDDAELGGIGSARLRDGHLVVDLIVNGSVRNVPPDEGKQALYPPGRAPAKISSAGFATIRFELDPRQLDGVGSMYMVNVVNGNLVQGPVYVESTLSLDGK